MESVLACFLHADSQRTNVASRFAHRLDICDAWSIPPGSRLLDIGCGQGESTLVLAAAVGPAGGVTGVDDAPPDYGGPYTVGQAQDFILRSSLGRRVAFQRSDTTRWLRTRSRAFSESSPPVSCRCSPSAEGLDMFSQQNPQTPPAGFDAAVFLHSLWYFPSSGSVRELLEELAIAGIPRIYVAEWSGQPRSAAQEPHGLAAEAQRRLYSLRSPDYVPRLDEQNIRGGALLPDELVALAQEVGWRVAARGSVPTPPAIRDGHWEAQSILRSKFSEDVEAVVRDPVARSELLASRDKIASMLEALKAAGTKLESMDTVWLVLERKA